MTSLQFLAQFPVDYLAHPHNRIQSYTLSARVCFIRWLMVSLDEDITNICCFVAFYQFFLGYDWLFCAAIRRISVSLLRSSVLSYVHVFSCLSLKTPIEMLFFSLLLSVCVCSVGLCVASIVSIGCNQFPPRAFLCSLWEIVPMRQR